MNVQPGDEVLCSNFTFVASVSPVVHERATPVFIDSEPRTWNMDPALLAEELAAWARRSALPRAVIVVHSMANRPIWIRSPRPAPSTGVPLIEDAAESLGATYRGRHTGTVGRMAAFSFNGNKIITTSGGGILVSDDQAEQARYFATQARQPAPHYEHLDVGQNYRLSNLLAAVGLGQMDVLDERVRARRSIFAYYEEHLADVAGISFMPEPDFVHASRWLTCVLVDPEAFGEDTTALRLRLEKANVESRPLWKPMHMQPIFRGCRTVGGRVCEAFFAQGLCLPSRSGMEREDLERVVSVVRRVLTDGGPELEGVFDEACRALGIRHTRTKTSPCLDQRLRRTSTGHDSPRALACGPSGGATSPVGPVLQRILDGFMRH